MIPRVLHRIWLGTDPMPEEFLAYGETWRRHHPGWEMPIWTEDNMPDLGESRPAFDRGRNHSERSNVLRYELLRSQGGVYIDTDMECLRPIDPLIEGVRVFAAYQRPGRLGSAIIGAEPGHPAFEDAISLVRDRTGEGEQVNQNGPGFLTEMLAGHSDVTYFDAELFYPYTHNELYRAGEEFPEAYAIHRWSKTWETREELKEKVERLQRRLDRFKRHNRKRDAKIAVLEARLEAFEHAPWRRLGRGVAGALRSRGLPAPRPERRRPAS